MRRSDYNVASRSARLPTEISRFLQSAFSLGMSIHAQSQDWGLRGCSQGVQLLVFKGGGWQLEDSQNPKNECKCLFSGFKCSAVARGRLEPQEQAFVLFLG